MEEGTEGTATIKGIGWLTCPLKEQLHPGKGGQKIPEGGKVKILTTTMVHLGESYRHKVESASNDSTFAWSW